MGMANEDAIKWLENLKQDIGQLRHEDLWPYAQAIDEIIDMLEEQDKRNEPVNAVIPNRDYLIVCPKCEAVINVIHIRKYCGYCGQDVKRE